MIINKRSKKIRTSWYFVRIYFS